ncbi:MAG: M20/M25/M40 family metallo-hydrolase [Candidatus Latescibacterota bacterium]
MNSITIDRVREAVRLRKDEWIDFCRRLIQTPSPTYGEEAVAGLIMQEMKKLRYDDVWKDGKGNVIGVINGTDTDAPVINLNSHMDQVAPGDEKDWPFPPFAAHMEGGRIYGRGASDTKGAIAVQTYAPGVLLDIGIRPRSTVIATFVVEEEIWGQGTYYLLEKGEVSFDLSILGEGTSNEIMLGHRGCIGIYVTFIGKSAHASMPSEGHNPNIDAARFILRLQEVQEHLAPHPDLGRTTMTPTIYSTGNISRNVIPEKVMLYVDCRQSLEKRADLIGILQGIADELGIRAEVSVVEYRKDIEKISDGFSTPRNHPYIQEAQNIVQKTLDREVEMGYWRFCTDGRLLAAAGIPTFGFSPCEATLAHTYQDSVSIPLMEESLSCYPFFFLEMHKTVNMR